MASSNLSTVNLPALGNSQQLSLPDLLDFHLEHNSDFPIFVFNEAGSTQRTEISMLEYVRAAHRVGKAIHGDSQSGDVIAIVANIDTLLYSALITGIIKAGLVPFPISPRNSPAALLHLIRKTSTRRLLTTQATLRGILDGLRAEIEMTDPSYALSIEEVPSLQEAFPRLGKETAQDPFSPFAPSFSPKDSDKGIYLHSSGSTGFPKSILLTHQIIKDDASLLFIPRLRELSSNPVIGTLGLPTFHMMGFCYQVLAPLYGLLTTAILPPVVTKPSVVPTNITPETVLEAAKVIKPTGMIAVPTFFHTWAQSDEAVEFLRTLRFLMFGGGPLSPSVAEYLIGRGVPVFSGYGGTEFGVVSDFVISKDNWQYLQFMDRANIRWVPQGDGTFEAQFLTCETHHVAVENLPDVTGYATQDVFEPHPTIPNLWKIVGRIDDVLIHSSGEKTVPAPMEGIISASPMLSGAIMFGRQRDQPGILLEPVPAYQIDIHNDSEVSKFRNMIWDVIESANKIAPSFSRIFKEMILIADPKKPLPRVGKGTLARKAALALYDPEINKIYETVESNSGGDSVVPPRTWENQDLEPWLAGQISDILSAKAPATTADLFEHGLDSLSSTIFRLHIVAALRKSSFPAPAAAISQSIIYNYPTIAQLAEIISKLVADPNRADSVSLEQTHEEAMEEMISKYSHGLDAPLPKPVQINTEKQYVLLTGSTGNLGAQLLESLLLNDSVARVYALNRPSTRTSMFDRHLARFQDKALDSSVLSSSKLVFLAGETSRENLGLSEDTLKELRQNLTMVIHNAWKLDFNLSLASFESHVKGSRALIDLARSSRHSSSIRFLFTSSIASTQSWNAQKQGPYPEHVVMDAKYAVGGGYGESKYVTERILAKSGLQATSFRIGQVAGGAPNGAWATSDWVPIIVKSSLSLNMLPDAFGVVSWTPMDAVCNALIDVGFSPEHTPMAVNVVHPNPVSWTFVMETIRKILIEAKNLSADALSLVPYSDWLAAVEQCAQDPTEMDTQNIPAVKLVDFYRQQANVDNALRKSKQNTMESAGLTPLSTENVKRMSQRMRTLGSLDSNLIQKWVQYWINAGF
ncbi:hypothetical protein GYMLUDRAFT_194612 [Collybiopsis luxurians FD-317 M1]|nr:hypothetical protein GYMLUDRAFT_194612 [Collybiopsis luxurians FD-317 M1]